ncbi:MAG: DUF5615 family PIN-like protein [Lewinellaceae bacterium]|nr:DUF5615 family PIN-like protein [Lewinellaceae bacterium]MCB9290321.1 DUF5615 family PIN-like protein [Lewinellaceae bacterium]
MRFIIDAHLPKNVAKAFINLGHIAIHTSELPAGNATNDNDIISVASNDGIVVSKDEDFYQSFLLYGKPPQLIHVKVGNMKLKDVTGLFNKIAPRLIDLLGQYDLLEVHRDKIIAIV